MTKGFEGIKMKILVAVLCVLSLKGTKGFKIEYKEEVEGDVNDLMEMIPYKEMLGLGMEYAASDEQTITFVNYLQSDKFSVNLQEVKATQQILAEAAGLGDTFKNLMEKFEGLLKITSLAQQRRTRRGLGDGLLSLIKEEVDLIPLVDIKESYQYKINNNPNFKDLMDKLLSDEVKEYIDYISGSKPFQNTKEDLIHLGIPVDDIVQFVSDELTEFFFLDVSEESEEQDSR